MKIFEAKCNKCGYFEDGLDEEKAEIIRYTECPECNDGEMIVFEISE